MLNTFEKGQYTKYKNISRIKCEEVGKQIWYLWKSKYGSAEVAVTSRSVKTTLVYLRYLICLTYLKQAKLHYQGVW